MTCGGDSTPDHDGDSCECPEATREDYDLSSNSCICPPGSQMNSTVNICQRIPRSTTTTTTTAAP